MGFDGIHDLTSVLNEGRVSQSGRALLRIPTKDEVDTMIDIGSAASLVSSLKTVGEIGRAMSDLRDAKVLQDKVIDLNREIIAAQTSAIATQVSFSELAQEVRELKSRIAELEAWEQEKLRYQLTDHGGGTFTYALKRGMENGEPFHRICAHCYQGRRKSLLQSHGVMMGGQEKVSCNGCDSSVMLGQYRDPGPMRAQSDYDPWGT